MSDTLSMVGSVRITLSHEGIDQSLVGPNAISTECYNYLMNCMTDSGTAIKVISNIQFFYNIGTLSSNVITTVTKSRPTEKSALFTAELSNTIPIKDVYEARLITADYTTYSSFALPTITTPGGYTMSVAWTIAYP